MDSYVKNITVDVNAEENYTMVKAKQGDKVNRKLAIKLMKDGANFTVSGASEIWFRMEKPDGNVAIVKSTDSGSPITSSGNTYTVALTEECLTASGEAWCDIAFMDASGNTLSSAAFVMKIIPMPNGDSVKSSSAWTDLQKAIDDAENMVEATAFRMYNEYLQYTTDGETWVNIIPKVDLKGDTGATGQSGEPVVRIDDARSIVSFDDGAEDTPVKSLVVDIQPVQSGTDDPSPTNIRPIAGWTRCRVGVRGAEIPLTWIDGYYLDAEGVPKTGTNVMYSEQVDAVAGYYHLSFYSNTTSSLRVRVHGYDSSGNWVRQLAEVANNSSVGLKESMIAVQTDVAFIRISTSTNFSELEFSYQKYYNIDFPVLGKNLFYKNIPIADGWYNDNGILQASTTTGHSELMKALPNTAYTLSGTLKRNTSYTTGFYFWDKDQNFISRAVTTSMSSQTVTTPATCEYISLQLPTPSNTNSGLKVDTVQVEQGSSATAYEAYNGAVYSGTLDVTNGVLTVDKRLTDITGADISSTGTASSGINYAVIPLAKFPSISTGDISRMLCNMYVPSTNAQNNNAFRFTTNCYIYDNRFVDLETAQSLIDTDNVQIVYPLDSPVTYQLSPVEVQTLLGVNNILADTGNVLECEYYADAKAYTDAWFNDLRNTTGEQYAHPNLLGSINEDGEVQSTYFHSELIPVEPLSRYQLEFTNTTNYITRIHAYTANASDEEYDISTWIKQIAMINTQTGSHVIPFSVDDVNIRYIRISARGDVIQDGKIKVKYIGGYEDEVPMRNSVLTPSILSQKMDNLMQLTSPSNTNVRFISLRGNRIRQLDIKENLTGSTYYSFLISKTPRYLGGNQATTIAALTADDFMPFEAYTNQSVVVEVECYCKNYSTANGDGPQVVIATRNPETEEVTYYQPFSVSATADGIHAGTITYLLEKLPEIRSNKNIAVIFRSRRPSVECDMIINFRTSSRSYVLQSNLAEDVDNNYIASKAYSVNDFLVVQGTLYKVTQPIASGAEIIPETNVVATTIGAQITALLNA